MTAVTSVASNLGRGGLSTKAHLNRGSDRADATLSAANLTVTWIGLAPADQRALAGAFRDLADKLDALDVDEPIDLYPTGADYAGRGDWADTHSGETCHVPE